jgi:hypothetical protein
MYYVMACYDCDEPTSIRESPRLPGGPWMDGQRITITVPNPLVYGLDPNHPGELLPLYENEAVPLFRDDLLDALRQAGVDNLECFPAVLRDPFRKTEHTNYKAVNIVGVVSCADMGQSELMGSSTSNMIDVDFAGLVIDEKRTGGALLFRLAEAVNAIVVHEKVKQTVEAAGIPFLTFQGPGEWAG